MTWFETLTGFLEDFPQQVRNNMTVDGETLTSHANGKVMVCGRLETPTLAELRERVRKSNYKTGKLSVREVIANVRHLHADEANAGSFFQVASQFNLLEMVNSNVTPEEGVGIYERDRTQGPACAIAAGAGTIYRNYFAIVNGQIGQSATNQIDCLADMGTALGNSDNRLWKMKNGYALASHSGLVEITNRLRSSDEKERDRLRELLRVGIQWNTQVTIDDCQHQVSQAYCSALPVAYSMHSALLWEEFAKLVLEASYEATICAAILNAIDTGSNRLFLTLLGGGAFGNEIAWIVSAMQRALNLYKHVELDVAIVSYRSSNSSIGQLLQQI